MAPQIGFPGLAPRSGARLCFTMVEGSNRRREGGNVSRGFWVSRATALAGSDWFLRCKSVPNLAKNALPFNFEQLRDAGVVSPQRARRARGFFGVGGPAFGKAAQNFFCWVGQTAPAVAVRCSMTRRALDSRCGENDGGWVGEEGAWVGEEGAWIPGG